MRRCNRGWQVAMALACIASVAAIAGLDEAESCVLDPMPEVSISAPDTTGPNVAPFAVGLRSFHTTLTGVEAQLGPTYAPAGSVTTGGLTPTALTVGFFPNASTLVFPSGGVALVPAGDQIFVYKTMDTVFNATSLVYTIPNPFGSCAASFAGEPVVMSNVAGADYIIATFDSTLCMVPDEGVAIFRATDGSLVMASQLSVTDIGSFVDVEPVGEFVVLNAGGETLVFAYNPGTLALTLTRTVVNGALDIRIKVPPTFLTGGISTAYVIGRVGGDDALFKLNLTTTGMDQATLYTGAGPISDYIVIDAWWTANPVLPSLPNGESYSMVAFTSGAAAVHANKVAWEATIFPTSFLDLAGGALDMARPFIPNPFEVGAFYGAGVDSMGDHVMVRAGVDPGDTNGRLVPMITASRDVDGTGNIVGFSSTFSLTPGPNTNLFVTTQTDRVTGICAGASGS